MRNPVHSHGPGGHFAPPGKPGDQEDQRANMGTEPREAAGHNRKACPTSSKAIWKTEMSQRGMHGSQRPKPSIECYGTLVC